MEVLKRYILIGMSIFTIALMAGPNEVQQHMTELNYAINEGDRGGVVAAAKMLILATDKAQEGSTDYGVSKLKEMNRIAYKLTDHGYTLKFDQIEGLFGKLFTLMDEWLIGEPEIGSH